MDLRVLLFFFTCVCTRHQERPTVCVSEPQERWALFYFSSQPLSCVTNHVEFIILSADYDRTTFHFQQLLSAHTSPVPSDERGTSDAKRKHQHKCSRCVPCHSICAWRFWCRNLKERCFCDSIHLWFCCVSIPHCLKIIFDSTLTKSVKNYLFCYLTIQFYKYVAKYKLVELKNMRRFFTFFVNGLNLSKL